MADVLFRAPLVILFIAIFCFIRQHETQDKFLNNCSYPDELEFNFTFASKQVIQAGLARARGTKSDVFQRDSNRHTKSLTTKIFISLLFLCGDIQLNPGPCKFPCGICGKPVKVNQKGIQCDFCDIWHHKKCLNMDNIIYEALANTSCVWECCSCGLPNFSSSLFDSLQNLSHANQFSSLNTSSYSNLGSPAHASSPSRTNQSRCGGQRSLSILIVNFQSVMAKNQHIAHLVEETKPDLIIGTETWLTPDHSTSEILISDQYTIERRDRTNDPHGGVLIAAKKHLSISREYELETDCEILWCKVKLTGTKTVYIGAYYRPHVDDELSLTELESSLSLIKNDHHILLGGDFNLPGWDWKNQVIKPCNYPTLHNYFGDILDDKGLIQLVDLPTRHQNTLDLAITNAPSNVVDVSVIPGVSDHDCPLIQMDLEPIRYKQKPREIPLYNKASWDSFAKDLFNVGTILCDIKNGLSANELWVRLKSAIHRGIKKHIPHKRCKSKDNLPWITNNIKKLIRKRDKLYRKKKTLLKSHTSEGNNLSMIITKIRETKRTIQQETRRAYWDYVESIITPMEDSNNKTCLKRFWTFIKHCRADTAGIPSLDINGEQVTAPEKIANYLNIQFQSVFTRERPIPQDLLPSTSPHPSMPDIIISTAGVLKLLQNLQIHKAPGPDGIGPRILKELSTTIAPILSEIYKRSYESGEVPEDWKTAYVTPVFKKGKKTDVANYRPISLTSIACKLMEHILVSGIMKHTKKNDILYNLQCGFREKRSCQTQLVELIHDLASSMQGGGQSDVLLLDFAKAFDKVGHHRMIRKLDFYGVRGKTQDWIKAFLSNRTQQVVLSGEHSDKIHVQSGVPQGSVLGPCLFLLYVNDLAEGLSSTVRLFADDTILYLAIESKDDPDILQEDLKKLEMWSKDWQMELNTEKCKVLRVTRKRTPLVYDYTLHGKTLKSADCDKYLGVYITHDLSWNTHVSNIVNKGNRTLGVLRRNLQISSPTLKSIAYKSLVRPILEYSSAAWDPYTQHNIDKIEMVQRRAARYALNNYNRTSSVTDMLKELGWDTLELRRKRQRLSLMYMFQNDLAEINKQKYLAPKARTSRHLHKYSYKVPPSKTNYHKFSFFPRTIKDWNTLPINTVEAPSLVSFKVRLEKSGPN